MRKMNKYRVIYKVEEIRGSCPLYTVGDRIVFDSHYPVEVINKKESDEICKRAIENMWTHYLFQAGSDAVIAHTKGVAGECRIACAMPGEPYSPCGTVIFRIGREKLE